jgi:hypothetical protein
MQRIILTVVIFAIVSISAAAAADQPPHVSLRLLPAMTLPGLPVGFLITIDNPYPHPAVIVDGVRLKVTNAAGTFDAVRVGNKTTATLPADQMEKCNSMHCLTVPPNGQRQLYIRFGPWLVENEFFADRRLSIPGIYGLEVTLSVEGDSGFTEVRSDTQTLVIQQPAGVDLAVWNFLQQTSGGKGWIPSDWLESDDSVLRNVRVMYPSSTYAAWLGTVSPTSDSITVKLQQIDAALAANPPATVRDELLLAKGGLLQASSNSAAFSERDVDKAVTLADQARIVFASLRDTGQTAYVVKLATAALSHLLTRATATDEVRSLSEHDAPAPAHIVPRVDCVTKGAGQSFSARFGYSNPNRVTKVIQIGSDNQVTPAPHEQGQPRNFKPGDHASVFVASSSGGNLKWHLDGGTATATADLPRPCTP